MKAIYTCALLCISNLAIAQIDPNLLLGIKTATTIEISNIAIADISEGSLIYDTDLKSLLHFNNSQWVIVSDESNKTNVNNELIFEDTPYYYVSMSLNNSSWVVIRYDRSNINIEERATGNGIQPLTLAECIALVYS